MSRRAKQTNNDSNTQIVSTFVLLNRLHFALKYSNKLF